MVQSNSANYSTTGMGGKVGNLRWAICGLLFIATTTNYMDRQVLSLLEPMLAKRYNWTQTNYGYILAAFQFAYAIGLLASGWVLDRIGVRWGLFIAALLWSIVETAHGLIRYLPKHTSMAHAPDILAIGGLSVATFGLLRAGLGLAEAANFPAAIKAVGLWFPQRERSLATGILNSGANIGAIAAPLVVPWIVIYHGWAAAFYYTGALGIVFALIWAVFYRDPQYHRWLGDQEMALIKSDPIPPPRKIPWHQLLRYRQTWAFMVGKFFTDPIWWFFLFWMPDFLSHHYQLNLVSFSLPIIIIYQMSTLGSIGGGWLSSWLLKRGYSVNFSRKIAMLACAICVVPVIGTAYESNLWIAVMLIGLATAAHQGWSANIFTIASDTAPASHVASLVGLGGAAGAIGGIILPLVIGPILTLTHDNYLIPFCIAGFAYLLALLLMQLIMPQIEPFDAGMIDSSPLY